MATLIDLRPWRRTALASALAAALPSWAQQTLPAVTVTGRSAAPVAIGGWGDAEPARTPIQASVVTAELMRDAGMTRIADLTRIDPAVGDAYNAEGYWDSLTVRGFVIDNRANYRRDGMPINAETSIPLDSKDRVELLKGLSGLQAGTSAPGGLVNLVVKRPLPTARHSLSVGWRETGSLLTAIDSSQRFGEDGAFGLRANAAYEHFDPQIRDARGHRTLIALAGEQRVTSNTLIEAEFESSRRTQPSVPGFSLLGDTVPDPKRIDPRVNLNNQPWSQPVVLEGDTASIRLTQALAPDWRAVAQLMTQRLRSDDRVAFPFGVFDPATFACAPCDRFAADGTFTLWQFISDDERRRTDAADLSLAGRVAAGATEHRLQFGVLRSRLRARFGLQVFDIAGVGNIDGTAITPPSTGTTDPNTNRDEDSTELYARDEWRVSPATSVWLGARHTQLARSSVRTDGSQPTDYRQSFTTPFIALTQQVAPSTIAYASWGRGVETEVAPNRTLYTNAGQPLPALESRQIEVGLKADDGRGLAWSAVAFDIERPLFADVGTCDVDASCTHQVDGAVRHRGVELAAWWRAGAWTLAGGAQWLHARRDGSVNPSLNGLRPVNVPERTLKFQVTHDLTALPGLALQAGLVDESPRIAVPDNSARIDGWTRLDAAARYAHRIAGRAFTWRVGVDNVADRRAWKESPYQFNHAYLFPLPPRTWRASLNVDL